jgi:hypothetical protein
MRYRILTSRRSLAFALTNNEMAVVKGKMNSQKVYILQGLLSFVFLFYKRVDVWYYLHGPVCPFEPINE